MKDLIYSNAHSDAFNIVIQDFDDVQFKIFDVQLPMISTSPTMVSSGQDRQLHVGGTNIEYDPLQIDFFVDEKWRNYVACFKWLKNHINSPDHFKFTKNIIIIPLDNSRNELPYAFEFLDAFPLNLAPIPLDSNDDSTDIVMGLTVDYGEMQLIDWFGEK